MFWERRLGNWVDDLRNRAALPLRLELWNGQQLDFGHQTPQVTIRIPHVSALNYLLTPSLFNLGKAYVEGKIEVDGNAKEIISIGGTLAEKMHKPESRFARITRSFQHTKGKEEKGIHYHGDISNDFYKKWLDENMVYSSAYFENGDENLDTAQLKKIDHILCKIQVRPGHTLLDIGCGWGALVIHAAEKYGAKCIGTTLSHNQFELAKERVSRAGLSDRVEIRLEDYRDTRGTFDRVTSIGMFEHVGAKNLTTYFSHIASLLKDDGVAMHHGINTVGIDNSKIAFGGTEFIEKYVFPHGKLAHIGTILRSMQEGGLEPFYVENLRRHHAKTCSIWSDNFEANTAQIQSLIDEKYFRIWRVYLAGCAYAFSQNWASLYQVVCMKVHKDVSTLP